MLFALEGEMNRSEIMEAMGLKDEKHFRRYYQQTAIAAGLIEMTIPDKPNSSKQRYRLTALGKTVLR
ncbi:Fic family protein [Pirellulaceae bacterium SH449]